MRPVPWGLGGLWFMQSGKPSPARKEAAALIIVIVLCDPRIILQGRQEEPHFTNEKTEAPRIRLEPRGVWHGKPCCPLSKAVALSVGVAGLHGSVAC